MPAWLTLTSKGMLVDNNLENVCIYLPPREMCPRGMEKIYIYI